MYEQQVKLNFEGLSSDVTKLCDLIGLEDANITEKGKKEYANLVKKACREYDEKMMKNDMERMKESKMKRMWKDDLRMKDYVRTGTLYSVRKTWEARSYMLRVAGNFPNQKKYQRTGWLCQACDLRVREDQDHLTSCKGYADLRDGKDLDHDSELVDFFRGVMERREKEGWS